MITINNTVDAGTSGGVGLKIISVNGMAMPICPYLMMNCWMRPTSTEPSAAPPESGPTSAVVEPNRLSPPPEVPGRADFRVGHRVTFIDKNLQPRVGMIVRVNQHTATLDCDGQKWRVAFELLRPLVSV